MRPRNSAGSGTKSGNLEYSRDSDVGFVGVNQCLSRVRYEVQGPAAACIKFAVKLASDECENPESTRVQGLTRVPWEGSIGPGRWCEIGASHHPSRPLFWKAGKHDIDPLFAQAAGRFQQRGNIEYTTVVALAADIGTRLCCFSIMAWRSLRRYRAGIPSNNMYPQPVNGGFSVVESIYHLPT